MERAFCKMLKIKRMERVLLLQGMEYREEEIAREVARALIFVADFVFLRDDEGVFPNSLIHYSLIRLPN